MVSLVAVPCRYPPLLEADKENLIRRASLADIKVLEERLDQAEFTMEDLTEKRKQFFAMVTQTRRR